MPAASRVAIMFLLILAGRGQTQAKEVIFVERILTVVTSLRQQGRDVLEYLTSACMSVNGESNSICLVPDSG